MVRTYIPGTSFPSGCDRLETPEVSQIDRGEHRRSLGILAQVGFSGVLPVDAAADVVPLQLHCAGAFENQNKSGLESSGSLCSGRRARRSTHTNTPPFVAVSRKEDVEILLLLPVRWML